MLGRRQMSVVASPMMGMMQDHPLLVSSIIEYATKTHGDTEVASRMTEYPDRFHRYKYSDVGQRSKKLANALNKFGVGIGDRIATIAWNGYRHLELYYGVSGKGSVLHTVNPRLQPDQISYVVNHAENKMLFVDVNFYAAIENLIPTFKTVKGVVILTDKAHMPKTDRSDVFCYEDLIQGESTDFAWPNGTTGLPKGVVYSHRSTLLHALTVCTVNGFALGCSDAVLPVVPMFHVNAWGIPYAAAMAGAKLVLPAAALDAPRLHAQLHRERVTVSAGVPLIFGALLQHMEAVGDRLPALERLYVGGAACPPSQIDAWTKQGVKCLPAWGMTEMSPLGVINYPKLESPGETAEQRRDKSYMQGRELFGVELRLVDEAGRELPRDGAARGSLHCRGPWVASSYFGSDKKLLDDDGWMDTGDVSTITRDGYMKIVDRAKDVIKSGGEWISSIDVENVAMAHPAVAQAAVVGVPHPKWDERPLLVVTLKENQKLDKEEMHSFLASRLTRSLYVPDDVVVVAALPVGGTGKIVKRELKEAYKHHFDHAA